jgi:hypothetical protein
VAHRRWVCRFLSYSSACGLRCLSGVSRWLRREQSPTCAPWFCFSRRRTSQERGAPRTAASRCRGVPGLPADGDVAPWTGWPAWRGWGAALGEGVATDGGQSSLASGSFRASPQPALAQPPREAVD